MRFVRRTLWLKVPYLATRKAVMNAKMEMEINSSRRVKPAVDLVKDIFMSL